MRDLNQLCRNKGRAQRGAAMVEYVILLLVIAALSLFSVHIVGRKVKKNYDDVTVVLSDPDYQEDHPLPVPPEDPEDPAEPVIILTDWGRLIDGQPCPDLVWQWDPYALEYTVPGVAHPHPMFSNWVGRRIQSGVHKGQRPDEWSTVHLDRAWDEYNYWGEYFGVTSYIYDTFNWTGKIYYEELGNPPHAECENLITPDPNQGADPGVYAGYYPDPAGGEFLEGTPGRDELDMAEAGPFAGVYGRGWEDRIQDTTAREVIIGGGDDDTITSRGGADTYLWATEDGNDNYTPRDGTADIDRVVILGLNRAAVAISVINDDLRLVMPSGETVVVLRQAADDPVYWTDELVFDDATIQAQDYFDSRVASQKAGGTVTGTNRPEAFVHAASLDGSYTLQSSTGSGTGDTLTFSETNHPDAKITYADGGRDLLVILPDGDAITVLEYFSSSSRRPTLHFADGTVLTYAEVKPQAEVTAREDGMVYGTKGNDAYVHTMSEHGSYRIAADPGGSDSLTFTDVDENGAKFARVGNDMEIRLPDGDLITLTDIHLRTTDNNIESFVFTDGTLSERQMRDKMVADMKSTGAVLGTDNAESYFHTASVDGSYTIYDYRYRYHGAGDDVLTFVDAAIGDATFFNAGDGSLRITVKGDTITIIDQLLRSDEENIEQFAFTDGTLTEADMRNKMVADMKPTGAVVGTDDGEAYVHSVANDGSYTIYDDKYAYHNGGDDSFTVIDAPSSAARFSNIGGDDMQLTVGGDTITFLDVLSGSADENIERFSFTDRSFTEQEMRDRMVHDMKDAGAAVGTYLSENYTHTTGDGSYTLLDNKHYRYGSTNILTMTDAASTSVVAVKDDADLVLTSNGESIRIIDQFRNTSYGVDRIVFTNETWDRAAMSRVTE